MQLSFLRLVWAGLLFVASKKVRQAQIEVIGASKIACIGDVMSVLEKIVVKHVRVALLAF